MSGLPRSRFRFLPGMAFEPPRAVMTPRTVTGTWGLGLGTWDLGLGAWGLREILPRDERIFRNRALRDTADHVAKLPRGNARARSLRPDRVRWNRLARGDV